MEAAGGIHPEDDKYTLLGNLGVGSVEAAMAVDEACAAADLGCEVYMCWRAVSSQGVVSAVRV